MGGESNLTQKKEWGHTHTIFPAFNICWRISFNGEQHSEKKPLALRFHQERVQAKLTLPLLFVFE